MYKVATWNINGLRSAKDLKSTLDDLDSDIICIQETKITRDMLTEPLASVAGYTSYFDFSRRRSGYSGVATYCRLSATPVAAEVGVAGSGAAGVGVAGSEVGVAGAVGCYGELAAELDPAERRDLDSEGRCVLTLHRVTDCQCAGGEQQRRCHVALLNVYCPRADPERPDRLAYKLLFYRALRLRTAALRAAGHHVLLVGDLNCSHRPIDSCDPGDLKEFAASPSRRFLDSWLCEPPAAGAASPDRLVDTFRLLHPAAAEVYTCWNTQRAARQLNFGTRIDYVLCDAASAAAGLARGCDVLADVPGSDHCPVRAAVGGQLLAAARPPPACSRYFPELAGRQLTIRQWCARPTDKRPADPPAGRRQAKRPRGGQATLLGFVRRVSAPAAGTGEPQRTIGGGETPADGLCNGSAASSDSRVNGGTASSDSRVNGVTASSDSTVNGGTASSDSRVNGSAAPGHSLCTGEAVPVEVSPAAGSQSGPADGGGCRRTAAAFWSETLRAVRPPPCRGHAEPCVQRAVKKAGPNLGKQFWCCARGVGKPGDPQARCGHFEWLRRS